jgi:hypothetical protein
MPKKNEEKKLEKAKKNKVAMPIKKTRAKKESEHREDFRQYFVKLSRKLSLDKYLEEILWLHLKTIKHDRKELFDDGIKHFGYKI